MIQIKNKEECCGCGACNSICPTNSIIMKQDREGFYYPKVMQEQCILCNLCEEVCPILNAEGNVNDKSDPKAFACYYLNEKIRSESTSGGVFSAIAEYFLEQLKGTVYGVRFNDDYTVSYTSVDNVKELKKIRGSKYIQCRTDNVYKEIKRKLDKKEYILFSGLPCQVQGLKSYLKKSYSSLYTIDMACFGIASPVIWNNYLDAFHKREKISTIVFKDKKIGWKQWCVKFVENEKERYYFNKTNSYMNSYLQRINVRPSCFECSFKGIKRNCDFTIADCWGIGEQNLTLNDDKGLSAVLIHSERARLIWNMIQDKMAFQEYPARELMKGNWALEHTPKKNPEREKFFDEIENKDFKNVFIKYFGDEADE